MNPFPETICAATREAYPVTGGPTRPGREPCRREPRADAGYPATGATPAGRARREHIVRKGPVSCGTTR